MFDWFDHRVLAALHVVLGYFCLCGSVGMAALIWRYRARFMVWRSLAIHDRADAGLNIGLLMLFGNGAYRQGEAARAYLSGEWKGSHFNIVNGAVHLPWAIVGMAIVRWWMCLYLIGPRHFRAAWWLLVGAGLWLGGSIVSRY